jgi:hypothetical protein
MTKRNFKKYESRMDGDDHEWDWSLNDIYRGSHWSSPQDAKIILEHFCYCVENKKPIPEPILEFLKDSFAEYLFDDKTLEASLKLKKNVGRTKIPGANEWPGFDYVFWIVEYMMEGFNKEKSLLIVENKLKESGKIVKLQTLRDHFNEFKHNALQDFISYKKHYSEELTEAQHQVIKDYFDK